VNLAPKEVQKVCPLGMRVLFYPRWLQRAAELVKVPSIISDIVDSTFVAQVPVQPRGSISNTFVAKVASICLVPGSIYISQITVPNIPCINSTRHSCNPQCTSHKNVKGKNIRPCTWSCANAQLVHPSLKTHCGGQG
jgi:hypothetical protein